MSTHKRMTPEQVAKKVQKLLALAGNNPNEQEAQAAMDKAQRLIAEYNIEMSEYDEDLKIRVVSVPAPTQFSNIWVYPMATVIAEGTACRVAFVKHKGITAFFYGTQENVAVAIDMFVFAVKNCRRLAKRAEDEYRKAYGTANGTAGSYGLGFVEGLKQKFDENCRALKIVVPEEVNEEFKKSTTLGKTKSTSIKNSTAYSEGVSNGRQFSDSRKIGG